MSKLFVFDFDGVLFHSAPECLEIAFRTASRDPERWGFARPWAGLGSPPEEVARLFLKFRYWVAPPWQYAVLLKLIAEEALPSTTEEFMSMTRRHKEELECFTDHYFATRAVVMKDRKKWLSLIRPIRPATDCFEELVREGRAAILSTRDPMSIQAIIRDVLGVELGPQHFLPRAGTLKKHELLAQLSREKSISPKDIFFLDDYLDHALPAYNQGFQAHLAVWGYVGPTDRDDALRAGMPVLKLEELQSCVSTFKERV